MLQYRWISTDITTEQHFDDMVATFKKVASKYGAFDTETTGLNIILDKPFLFQFGFVDIITKTGYTYAVDIEQTPQLSKRVLAIWHVLAAQLKMYAGQNVKFDLHMLQNIGMPYSKDNLTDTQFYIRYAHDALTVKNGGPPLKLKEYAMRYITPDAKAHDNAIQKERSAIAKQLNLKLKNRLKCTLAQLKEIFKDPIMEAEDLPEEYKEGYLDWLSQDVPLILQKKITGLAKTDIIPYSIVDRKLVRRYAHYDIIYTLEILMSLIPVVEARQNQKAILLENRLIKPFYEMERTGFKVNKVYLLQAKEALKQYIIKQRKKLYDLVGTKFVIGQHEVIKNIFKEKYGLTLDSTGKEILGTIIADLIHRNANPEAIQFIKLIQELRTLEKWYSVYIMRFIRDLQTTDTLHTQLNQVGTVSGRIASDFQQFPNEGILTEDEVELFNPRRMVIPNTDALVYIDYSQIELRFQAFYTILVGDPDLNLCRAYMPYRCITKAGIPFDYKNPKHIKAWNSGDWYLEEDPNKEWIPVDLHGATTELATGLTPDHPDFKHLRKTIGKRTNFAKNYGAQRQKIREMFPDKTEAEITRINDAYYKAFPGVKKYHDYCYKRAQRFSHTTNLFDIKYYNVSGHKLINMLVQGSAAFFLKYKIVELYDYIKANNLKTKMQMQIHDELAFGAAKDETSHFFEFKRIMEDWNDTLVPIVADMDASITTWAEKKPIHNLEELEALINGTCN